MTKEIDFNTLVDQTTLTEWDLREFGKFKVLKVIEYDNVNVRDIYIDIDALYPLRVGISNSFYKQLLLVAQATKAEYFNVTYSPVTKKLIISAVLPKAEK